MAAGWGHVASFGALWWHFPNTSDISDSKPDFFLALSAFPGSPGLQSQYWSFPPISPFFHPSTAQSHGRGRSQGEGNRGSPRGCLRYMTRKNIPGAILLLFVGAAGATLPPAYLLGSTARCLSSSTPRAGSCACSADGIEAGTRACIRVRLCSQDSVRVFLRRTRHPSRCAAGAWWTLLCVVLYSLSLSPSRFSVDCTEAMSVVTAPMMYR